MWRWLPRRARVDVHGGEVVQCHPAGGVAGQGGAPERLVVVIGAALLKGKSGEDERHDRNSGGRAVGGFRQQRGEGHE